MPLQSVSLDELIILDEASFAHVAPYAQLKRALREAECRFRIPARGAPMSWDRATFLNLTFWNAADSVDVLCESVIPADVVAHVAWHHLAAQWLAELAPGLPSAPCAAALLFGEAIASAFDLYLVGRLLRHAPDSDFIESQVSIMGEAAEQAGLDQRGFAALLEGVVQDPERAFADMRTLLFDVSRALLTCRDAQEAQGVFERFIEHRFEALLHHYQLSNWVLYARAFGAASADQESAVLALDAALRAAPVALDWLIEHWTQPAA